MTIDVTRGTVAVLVAGVLLSGCRSDPLPFERPTATAGAFVRAIPPDGTQPLDARSGEVLPPQSWPPTPLYSTCTPKHDELVDLEKSLGVKSVGCPAQYAPAPALGGEAPVRQFGFNTYCYPVGTALLVVETIERLGSCKHIVGLAVFHREGS
jgi:hypothetical protein